VSWNVDAVIIDGERTSETLLREDLAASPGAELLLWRNTPDGPMLGTVWIEPAETDSWYLGLLTVQPDLQERHLGRTILSAAEEFVKVRGVTRIEMTVVNVRAKLIAWYQRRGYTLSPKTKPFHYDDDRYGIPLRDDLYFVVLEKSLKR
jgi:GNAT superfamily N-acetyltransferase